MKTSITFSCLVIFLPFLLAGQNYQTVYPDREAYYQDINFRVEAIAMDSVVVGEITTLYPFRVNQMFDSNCYSPNSASWVGTHIAIADNGFNYYFNKYNDTIRINTLASLSDEWDAFYLEDSLLIRATVVGHDIEEFLGLTDSVKTIAFQAYNSEMEPVSMPLNEMQLKISKNYGFVQTFNFSLFPNLQSFEWPETTFQIYEVAGLSDPDVGIQNLTWFDVYDFQVGDELHILMQSGDWIISETENTVQLTETRSVLRYIDRIDYADSIKYTVSREQNVIRHWLDSLTYVYDTIVETIKPNPKFDHFPSQPVFDFYSNGDQVGAYNYWMMHAGSTIQKREDNSWYEGGEGGCWGQVHYDGVPLENYYLKGLGGPYSPYWSMFGSSYGRNLVWYRKGDTTWGTPLSITNATEQVSLTTIIVFPVPASDMVTIRVGNDAGGTNYSFKIFDTTGRHVRYGNLTNGDNIIRVESLKPGVYFYTIGNSGSVVKSGKIVIQ